MSNIDNAVIHLKISKQESFLLLVKRSKLTFTPKGLLSMAITKDKKQALVSELTELFANAKGTAVATYQGISVAELQELRKSARAEGVVIKVVKNRLVRISMSSSDTYKETDTSALVGQLLYAFSADDEVAPAKVLNEFGKTHPALELVAGFSEDGLALAQAEVKALAGLPSKQQLIAEVVAQLLSPVHDVTNGLSGNLHALLDGVADKATA